MPSPQTETMIRVRNFRGVNIAFDPSMIDDRDLQSSENWVPHDQTGLLTKRRGEITVVSFLSAHHRIDAMLRAYDQIGNRYLYYLEWIASSPDALSYLTGDGNTATAVTNGAFVAQGGRYGMALLGNTLYVGNGDPAHDPYLKAITLTAPSVAVNFGAILSLNDSTATAVASPAPSAAPPLDSGTYSYQWAVYNTVTGLFVSIGPPHPIQVNANQFVTFTAPTAGPGTNQVYMLFVTEVNLPIELATNQTPAGLGASGQYVLNSVNATTALVPTVSGVARTGRFLVAHRGTLFVAGDQTNPSAVYQSSVIVPGLEQSIFNLGNFFPALSQLLVDPGDGDSITGLGVASLTSTQESPSAPLVIFKNASTWLLSGDLNDPNNPGSLVQLSRRIGCIAHATIVNTPAGLIFCGHDSVYLLPPYLQEPVDIGWPISPVIRAIPNTLAPFCFAVFHNQFYKLYLVPAGGGAVTQSWWLDLHRQTVDSPPSWWGPHTFVYDPTQVIPQLVVHAATTGILEPAEADRGWISGIPPGPTVQGVGIALLDQPNTYEGGFEAASTVPIVSRLRTKVFGGDAAFDRKRFTGVRIIARAGTPTTLAPTVCYDGAICTTPPLLYFPASITNAWNGIWNGSWGFSLFAEGDTRLTQDLDRASHLYAEVLLQHNDPTQIDLRDLELRYLPVERPVA